MTVAPSRFPHPHLHHRREHVPLRRPHRLTAATVAGAIVAFLLALAIVLLLSGDAGESEAVGAVAAVSVTGWAFARRRKPPSRLRNGR